MEPPGVPDSLAWPFPFSPQDWEHTPPAVQAYLRAVQHDVAQLQTLQDRVAVLETSSPSGSTSTHRPPSSDNPYKKRRQRSPSSPSRKAGGNPATQGVRRRCCPPQPSGPTARPVCLWQHDISRDYVVPYAPGHRVASHCHGGDALGAASKLVWGLWGSTKPQVPVEHAGGYGPRFSALMAELAGTYGNGRRMVQTFCASVLQVPFSLGAIQKVLNRVTHFTHPPLRCYCNVRPAGRRQLYR